MGTLRLVYTNDFGDITDITKTIPPNLDEWFYPLKEMLLGCGFDPVTVNELMSAEYELLPKETIDKLNCYSGECIVTTTDADVPVCKCGHPALLHGCDDWHCDCGGYAPNK